MQKTLKSLVLRFLLLVHKDLFLSIIWMRNRDQVAEWWAGSRVLGPIKLSSTMSDFSISTPCVGSGQVGSQIHPVVHLSVYAVLRFLPPFLPSSSPPSLSVPLRATWRHPPSPIPDPVPDLMELSFSERVGLGSRGALSPYLGWGGAGRAPAES